MRDVAVPQDADAAERTVIVRAALAALTSKQRAVLLRFFDDLTERETARILGVSVGTVKSQTSVALGRLRERAPELAEFIKDEVIMAEQHLRTLLEDAAANVPAPNMAAAALAGARRRRMRRSLTFAAGVSAAGVALGAVALTSPCLSGGGEGEGSLQACPGGTDHQGLGDPQRTLRLPNP